MMVHKQIWVNNLIVVQVTDRSSDSKQYNYYFSANRAECINCASVDSPSSTMLHAMIIFFCEPSISAPDSSWWLSRDPSSITQGAVAPPLLCVPSPLRHSSWPTLSLAPPLSAPHCLTLDTSHTILIVLSVCVLNGNDLAGTHSMLAVLAVV